MSFALVIADSFIIVVNSKLSVLATWDKMLSFWCQINTIKFLLWSLKWSDNSSIVLLPISDFPVRSSRQNLILFRIEQGLLEGSALKQTQNSSMWFQVPNNARAISTSWHCLTVVLIDLNRPYSTPVFLKRGLHNLSLLSYFPDSDLPLGTSRDNSASIASSTDWSTSVIVSVIYNIEKFSWLW